MPVPRISRREQLHAALRLAEAVELRLSDCDLPETGWGTLTLRETRPVSGKQWADSGERHDRRGLAVRGTTTDRPVPIPPILVSILRAHLKVFRTAREGRVFGNERGGVVGSSIYWGCGRRREDTPYRLNVSALRWLDVLTTSGRLASPGG